MIRKLYVGVAVFFVAIAVAVVGDAGYLAKFVKALNSAPGLDVTYTLIEVGGVQGEYHVVLAKPDKAMIDTPTTLYVADGKNLTVLHKAKNTYIVREQTAAAFKDLLSDETLSLWRAFFDPSAFDGVESTKNEGSRTRRGEKRTIVSAQLDSYGRYAIRLHLGEEDSLVRQAEFFDTSGSTPRTHILTVKSMSTVPPAEHLFAFTAPPNARLLSERDLRAEAIAAMVVYAQSEGELGKSTYKPVQPENMDLAAGFYKAVIAEFSKYPRDFMEASNLKKIVLVEQILKEGRSRPAAPRVSEEMLYFDVTRFKNPVYARNLVHHEFFHMIDEEWYGSQTFSDPKWTAFNLSDFKYGSGGEAAILASGGQSLWPLSHPQPGFASKYTMSAIEEDKATLWAAMFVPERWALLKKIIAVDPIVGAKVRFLREFARSKSPEMEGEYWEIVVAEGDGS
ncbi:MAG: hypothetical protein IH944_02535 [Armatimonadetes bacterium]|nr:hypothetical protein [Armatimonadota bacterium]